MQETPQATQEFNGKDSRIKIRNGRIVKAKEYQLKVNGAVNFVRSWAPEQAPVGCVQIVHSLSEHGGRYAPFAAELNRAGYAVFAQDLPGHGRTARAPDELGHFADKGGWDLALQSVRAVQINIRERHPRVPLVLFGHSMGGLLAQDILVNHGRDLNGGILCATTGDMGHLRFIGTSLVRAQIALAGPRSRSRLADELSYKAYNRHFKPTRTAFDWLSRDPAEVDRYVNDPRCGFRASSQLWLDILDIGGRQRDPKRLARIPSALPILIIAGTRDPTTNGTKGPTALERAYVHAGLSKVSLKFYPDARHELLNDLCRDEVTTDIIEWLGSRVL